MDGVPFAAVYGGLGEADEAFRWLEKAYEDRTPAMVYTLLTSLLDPTVADDPRMRSLIRRMGYPTTEAEDSRQKVSGS